MSNYIVITDYAAKDNLLTGNPAKLVKGTELGAEFDAIQTAVATKADSLSPVLTTPHINDTSSDHQYIVAVSELTADRTVTLPLLTGDDTFVFNSHAATLTNKTVNLSSNTLTGTLAQFNTALSDADFASLAGSETLTNKTLTSPAINGTVTTTGLTLPALTLGGAITGNSQNISGLGTLGCGAITSTGAIAGTSLNIGTGALTAGSGSFSGSGPTVVSAASTATNSYGRVTAAADSASLYIQAFGSTFGGTAWAGLTGNNQVVLEGAAPSSFVISTSNTSNIVIAPNRSAVGTFSSTGLAVTGIVAATGAAAQIDVYRRDTNVRAYSLYSASGELNWYNGSSNTMTLDVSGNLLVGRASSLGGSDHGFKNTSTNYTVSIENTNAAPKGHYVYYSGASPNSTASLAFAFDDSTARRAEIRSNGGLANYSANNVNLSDERLKKDFNPAPSYYDRWKQIDFVTYLYKDQTDTELNLGVKAQQLETVCPELVDNSGFGEAPEGEAPYKAVYQTDFSYATAVALQEAIKKIDELTTRIQQLEAK